MKNNYQMIDAAKINIKAGKGGDGRVSFRHEKFIAKGGPDGGDGGRGGSVFAVADNNMATLLDFRSKPIYSAQEGQPGGKKNMSGGHGEDLTIRVPIGTLIYQKNEKDGRDILIADMNETGKIQLLARGGIGGKGNVRFKSSVNQVPTQYTAGTPGEAKTLTLEVKMVADVGFIGFPNAGKSTLLNFLTKTHVKVADYPFTTLSPNLGTLKFDGGKEIVFADIPGLIEGASQGKGLGDEFLRHVERTRLLIHLVDPTFGVDFGAKPVSGGRKVTPERVLAENSVKLYDTIRQELASYGASLDTKPEIVVINKMDVTEVSDAYNVTKRVFAKRKIDVLPISAATGLGLEDLIKTVVTELNKLPEKKTFAAAEPVKIFTFENLPNRRIVFRDDVKDWEGEKR